MHPTDTPAPEQGRRAITNADERLIRLPEYLALTGESRTVAYERIAAGDAPAPLKDGRASLWVLSEVRAYVAKKIANAQRKGQR